MSDQNKLLPCPFCGGAAILEPATGYDEYVSCSTPCCPAERLCASSVEKWNRRAALDRTEQNAAPQTPCTYDEGHHSGLSESSGSAKASKFPSGASHLVMANHLVPAQSAGAAPDKADAMPEKPHSSPPVPQWVTTWPDWYGPEFSHQNVTVVPKDDYLAQKERADRLQRERDGAQAQLDALMLEFCPDEMTEEQVKRWAAAQQTAGEAQHAIIAQAERGGG